MYTYKQLAKSINYNHYIYNGTFLIIITFIISFISIIYVISFLFVH